MPDNPEATLERLQRAATILAATAAIVVLWTWGWQAALALTLSALVSIVAFRELRWITGLLSLGGKRQLGFSVRLRIAVRYLALLLLPLLATWLDSRGVLALILGLSVVPAALLVEAAMQLVDFRSAADK